ncbi:MAG: endonuclease/exonuclease/phosphatase family protein [Natrialbaceae archaeon]|nr:endonuclease/exonuclease/phosphatase family protein [Natrialbaceae archaeon]
MAPDPIRACSFNVRLDTDEDERPWADRADAVVDILEQIDPDLLAIQEALAHQYDELRERLDWLEWHGVGRVDGEREGEFVPIAWRADRFEVLDRGQFWLSETPDEPGSVGWDGALPRVSSWALLGLEDRRLWVCSTHFDHIGPAAREQAAALIVERVSERVADNIPALVMGDLNSDPESAPYRTLVEGGLVDANAAVDAPSGPSNTFHGFTGTPFARIDYILGTAGIRFTEYATKEPSTPEHRSDHLPITATFSLE